ncbi:hypothetical protein [Peribacillus sp. SI8-4]|uniref:hypothetical protein n=1 Tax=Peribacillus sp. SI8-4 TaxID=3048009 RepID=UPI0025529071|nr:hypothetical protein [Peribacillus sp. SI8-4]
MTRVQKDARHAARSVALAAGDPLAARRSAALAGCGQHVTHKDVLPGSAQHATHKGVLAGKGTRAGNGVPATSAVATEAAALSSRRSGNGASSFMMPSHVF